MNKYIVSIVAIAGIVIIEVIAIWKEVNGTALAAGIGAIASLGGFTLGKILNK